MLMQFAVYESWNFNQGVYILVICNSSRLAHRFNLYDMDFCSIDSDYSIRYIYPIIMVVRPISLSEI